MATRDTIIYLLALRNQGQDPYFQISNFWALIWPQKGHSLTLSRKGPGLQNPTKKLAHGMELLDYS